MDEKRHHLSWNYIKQYIYEQDSPPLSTDTDSSEEEYASGDEKKTPLSRGHMLEKYIVDEYFLTWETYLSADSSEVCTTSTDSCEQSITSEEISLDEETPLSMDIPDIPEEFICPLSGKIFFDPVIADDGLVYERGLIEPYIKKRKNSPITYQPLFNFEEDVVTKCLIEEYLVEHPEHQEYVYLFDHNRKALLEAIKSQGMANIKALLKKDPRLYLQPLENGRNIFQWVCEAAPYGLFSELLTFLCAEKMLDTIKQAKRPDDWKPIRLNEKLQACIMEDKTNLNEIELLLALGAELRSKSPDGKSLLLLAVESKQIANIKALLKKDPRLYQQPLENGRNIFQWVCEAAPYGLFSELLTFLCAEKMLDMMKQANRPDDWKPVRLNEKLQACIMEGKTNLDDIELLLALGAELESKSPDGKSLLLLAVESKQIEIVKVLMAKGLKCTSEANQARLLYVAVESKETELINLIIQSGVPVDVKNVRGSSALHKAIMTKEIGLIEYLLEKGADPSVPDNQGNTSLHLAVQYKLPDNIVLLLIRGGADYRAFNKNGIRPINLVKRPEFITAMEGAYQDRMQAKLKESQGKLEDSDRYISLLEQKVKALGGSLDEIVGSEEKSLRQ